MKAHDGSIYALFVSDNGNFIGTGGKDMKVKFFEFHDFDKIGLIYYIETKAHINSLSFNPKFEWITIGTGIGWQIWDFKSKESSIIAGSNL